MSPKKQECPRYALPKYRSSVLRDIYEHRFDENYLAQQLQRAPVDERVALFLQLFIPSLLCTFVRCKARA